MVKITDKIFINPRKLILVEVWEDYYDHQRQLQLEEPIAVGTRLLYENRSEVHIRGVTPEQVYEALKDEYN